MKKMILLCYCFYVLVASVPPALGELEFVDVTQSSGLSGDTYFSPTSHSLGVNWVDIDRDGWDDLFVVGGGPGFPPMLFLNNRDGTFTRSNDLLPTLPDVEMSGSRFADYDRDGDKDLFIYTDNLEFRVLQANNPDGPANILLKNNLVESGQLMFTDQTEAANLVDLAPSPFGDLPAYRSKTASWLDYDRDGCIDLYVGHLVINSAGSEVNRDRFYRNDCGGSFTDVTSQSGINDDTDPTRYRAALASGGFQLNDDLWPDLYVVNVSGTQAQPYPNDFLFLNQGDQAVAHQFEELISQSAGVGDDAQAGMGIDVADIDHDGDWDIYISDIFDTDLDEAPLGNVLYLGTANGSFTDNSAHAAGVEGGDSWGVNFFDADNDTWEDLYVATISTVDHDFFYRNDGVGTAGIATFSSMPSAAGIDTANSRGSAVSDFDHDGDLDIVVVSQSGPLQLYRNDTQMIGNWLVLVLAPSSSNPDGIGTVVKARHGVVQQMRQVKGGSSAHSQDSLNVHFGFADTTKVDELMIEWPSGYKTILKQVTVNQYLVVSEDAVFSDHFEIR